MINNINAYESTCKICIYKDKISISEQETIRDDLMVAPYIPKSPAPPIKFPKKFLGGRITVLNIFPAIFPWRINVFVAST